MRTPAAATPPSGSTGLDLLAAGGEMGRRVRELDWAATPLGAAEGWPASLHTAVLMILTSRYPMFLWWGPELILIYNDAYAGMTLGSRHPWALGRPGPEVFADVWDDVGPRVESVFQTGQATWDEELLLILERGGRPQETYHTFSYSPIPHDGEVGGILCPVIENTQAVLSRRRLTTLRELAARTHEAARSAEDACRAAIGILAANPHDLPFALLYLLDADAKSARLAGVTGLPAGSAATPATVDLTVAAADGWPLESVLASGRAEVVTDLERRWGALPGGVWPEPPRTAVVLPLTKSGQDRLAGFLAVGVSPRSPLDDGYRGFFDLLPHPIATAVANARAYEEERRRAEALAEIDRAKTAFFSNVSHEFRTPLTLILGPLQELLAGAAGELNAAQRTELETLQRNAIRLHKLVNALLDVARVEAGRVDVSYEPVDLSALTRELASSFAFAAERAGLELEVDCPPLPEAVYVDRDLWEKIVLNLLSNAFKFTFEGRIALSLRVEGEAAKLRVADTGVGIPPTEVPRLFERFHRVQGTRARTQEGSGIGLALVRDLARLHGGAVEVDSAPGAGSTFTVSLPRGSAHLPGDRIAAPRDLPSTALGAAPYVEEALRGLPEGTGAALSPPAVADGEAPPARILLADDNADMRRYVRRLLEPRFAVEEAADGEAALAAARAHPPDLVLSDVMMPGLDGFALMRALRAEARTATVPVVLLSARAGEEARIEGMNAGADDYVVKPFGARELLARVAARLEITRVRRESERRIHALLESITDGFQVIDEHGRLTYMNPVARKFLAAHGLDPEALLGRRFWGEVLPDPEEGAIGRLLMRAVTERVPVSFETYYPPWQKWFESRVYPLPDGGLANYFQDVTRRKRAEARDAFLLRLDDAIRSLMDPRRIAEVAVERLAEQLGVDRAVYAEVEADQDTCKTVGEFPDGRLGSYRLSDYGHPLRGALLAGEAVVADDVEIDPRTRGWREPYRAIGVRAKVAVPLRRASRLTAVVAVHQAAPRRWREDEVELLRRAAERCFEAAERARVEVALQESNRRKDEFLATLAHELRNPLAPMRNGLHILRLAGADAAPIHAMMERQVGHMVRLVDDLLEMSRITRGKIELRREPVELGAVLKNAVETSKPLIEAAGHRLELELPPEPLILEADAVRLAQIFANLLNNAAKYTDAGGWIGLRAESLGDWAAVSVRDSGTGISADMLPHVFDLFMQGHQAADRGQGGLGVGLTLVRSLVQMHGGSVEARSEGLGRGSEFVVRLPLAPQGLAGSGAAAGPLLAVSCRVLVVDDNHDAADSLGTLLRLMGAEVRVVYDGPAALAALDELDFAAVVLDLGMPGMDGFEVAQQIRRHPRAHGVTLIALTGWGQEEDRRRSRQAGFDHHLIKPADMNALLALLAAIPSC